MGLTTRCPMSARAIIGARIAAARAALGLTRREVGEKVGLPAPFIHDVEHGNRSLAPARRTAFAVTLDISIAELTELDPVTLETVAEELSHRRDCRAAADLLRQWAKRGVI